MLNANQMDQGKVQFCQIDRKALLGESDSELVSSKWIPCLDSTHCAQVCTGTLNGRETEMLVASCTGTLNELLMLLMPNIVLLLLDCLLSELLFRCSNCSILDVTEEEEAEGRNCRRAMLLLVRGARNHSGSSIVDNLINVASPQPLLPAAASTPSVYASLRKWELLWFYWFFSHELQQLCRFLNKVEIRKK